MLILLSMAVSLTALVLAVLLKTERCKKALAVAVVAPLVCGSFPVAANHIDLDCGEGYIETSEGCRPNWDLQTTLCDTASWMGGLAAAMALFALLLSPTGVGSALLGAGALLLGSAALGATLAGACNFDHLRPPDQLN